ncbi:MAG: hypothetical protein JW917_02005 [Ignavibacteria bacterium]|nr:hypothetical protein [Ignavibacteria bacterium]
MGKLQEKLDGIKSKESWLEKIKRHIPGYDGYVDRDNSRELDTIIRNQLAQKLEQNKPVISNVVANFTKSGKLFEMQDIDKIEKKNETAIAKFRSAARGYTGAFDVVKIKDEKLNMLYEFDATLLEDVVSVNSMFSELEKLSTAGENVSVQVSNIWKALDTLILKFDERESLLRSEA